MVIMTVYHDGRLVNMPPFVGTNPTPAALVPGLDYSDLQIRDGDQASTAYAEMVQQDTPTDRRRQLRESLLAYCKRDTEAMVRLFNTLRGNSAC